MIIARRSVRSQKIADLEIDSLISGTPRLIRAQRVEVLRFAITFHFCYECVGSENNGTNAKQNRTLTHLLGTLLFLRSYIIDKAFAMLKEIKDVQTSSEYVPPLIRLISIT
jgi:hypothetical protein